MFKGESQIKTYANIAITQYTFAIDGILQKKIINRSFINYIFIEKTHNYIKWSMVLSKPPLSIVHK